MIMSFDANFNSQNSFEIDGLWNQTVIFETFDANLEIGWSITNRISHRFEQREEKEMLPPVPRTEQMCQW